MRLSLGDAPKKGETIDSTNGAAPEAVPAPDAGRLARLALGDRPSAGATQDPEAPVPGAASAVADWLTLGDRVDAPAPLETHEPTRRPPEPVSAPAPAASPKPAPDAPPQSSAPASRPAPDAPAPRPPQAEARPAAGLPPLPSLGGAEQKKAATPVPRPAPSKPVGGLPPLPDPATARAKPAAPTAAPARPAAPRPAAAAKPAASAPPRPAAPRPAPKPAATPPVQGKPAAPKPAAPAPKPELVPPSSSSGGGGGKPPVRLGDKLVDRGLISKDQLMVALQEKKTSPKMMGELLVDLGFITEQALSAVLAEDSGFERFDPAGSMVDPELLKMIPQEIANRYRVFPSTVEDKTARLAMADIYDVMALDQVKRHLPADWEIQPLVCSDTEIQQAIDQYYGHELSIDGILRELDSMREGDVDAAALDDTSTAGYTHPVVRLVNAILLDAVKSKASDIHFEPEGNFLRVRYRIDGMMMQIRTIHKQHWGAFSHRMKIMSGMNIADRLNPQDGRFSLAMANKRIDFRVSSLPTVHGENLVLRILDKSSAQVNLTDLGYSVHNFDMLTRMIRRPEGIIIVTGPTGSGKTTTLYAVMNYINSLDLNIMTLEDPVEFELSLIRQSQIREGSQMTFADGIRTLMRQDPDVILVGEVRDADTATMALRAAMTGHQVYTTLHTNDAAGAIPRLQDLGMKPSMMSGNIIGIVAQRLGRKLCEECKEPAEATEHECRILGVDPSEAPVIYHPKGCSKCRGTGYKGRIAVSEILPFNDVIDEMIIDGLPLSRIRENARDYGFVPMVDDGIEKVLRGVMSIEGLMKAVNITDRL